MALLRAVRLRPPEEMALQAITDRKEPTDNVLMRSRLQGFGCKLFFRQTQAKGRIHLLSAR